MNNSYFRLADNLISKKTKDFNTVYDSTKKKIYFLNDVAFFILEQCNKNNNFKKILINVEKKYKIKKNKEACILKDVTSIIKRFLKKGLISKIK